jgi:hypothetical protein
MQLVQVTDVHLFHLCMCACVHVCMCVCEYA